MEYQREGAGGLATACWQYRRRPGWGNATACTGHGADQLRWQRDSSHRSLAAHRWRDALPGGRDAVHRRYAD